jgi:hypothetical protein
MNIYTRSVIFSTAASIFMLILSASAFWDMAHHPLFDWRLIAIAYHVLGVILLASNIVIYREMIDNWKDWNQWKIRKKKAQEAEQWFEESGWNAYRKKEASTIGSKDTTNFALRENLLLKDLAVSTTCVQCHGAVSKTDYFCSACGTPVQSQRRVCAGCGKEAEMEDVFCATCGNQLERVASAS